MSTQRQVQYHIIGDVYVDLICYIPPTLTSSSSPSTTTSTSLPLNGTDTTLLQPIRIMAGGSTMNTATYLQYLHYHYDKSKSNVDASTDDKNSEGTIQEVISSTQSTIIINNNNDLHHKATGNGKHSIDICIHTVFNPNDHYGSVLIHHAKQYHITLQNGYYNITTNINTDCTNHNNHFDDYSTFTLQDQSSLSTPHCIVLVSSTSISNPTCISSSTVSNDPTISKSSNDTPITERTFLTHRGCASNMTFQDLFPNEYSVNDIIKNNTRDTIIHKNPNGNNSTINSDTEVTPIHIHIAGYYCTPGFWKISDNDTSTSSSSSSSSSSLLSFVQNIFLSSPTTYDNNIISSTPAVSLPIIFSLVTQYDASKQWDINILQKILPYTHICIMNELEAQQIYQNNYNKNNNKPTSTTITPNNDSVLINEMIIFFTQYNSSTIYVITQGINGAIAFRNGRIIAHVYQTVDIKSIILQQKQSLNNGVPQTNVDIVLDPTGAGDAFCAGFFHSLWQSIRNEIQTENNGSTVNIDIHSNSVVCKKYYPSEYYWSNDNVIQDALLFGCTMGTCAVSQRGASIPPTNPKLIQIVHEQYILLNPAR